MSLVNLPRAAQGKATVEQTISRFNPLTTDAKCTHHATLTACYQLAQSVLKIDFALAKMVGLGEVGGFQHGMAYTWQLPWLAVEKPWLAPACPFLSLTQTGVDKASLPL